MAVSCIMLHVAMSSCLGLKFQLQKDKVIVKTFFAGMIVAAVGVLLLL